MISLPDEHPKNVENGYPADEVCTASFWDLLVMLRVNYTMIAGDDFFPLVSLPHAG